MNKQFRNVVQPGRGGALERGVVRKIHEVSGDAAWIADDRTREILANYRLARRAMLEQPKWQRLHSTWYELQTRHGLLRVKHFYGAWFATRDLAHLIHAPDGRDALFLSLQEAQAASELHASDLEEIDPRTGDNLRWEPDSSDEYWRRQSYWRLQKK